MSALAAFGLFWAGLHFDVLSWVPDWLLLPMLGLVAAGNLVQFIWSVWKRRTPVK
jgi:hypothetical protein